MARVMMFRETIMGFQLNLSDSQLPCNTHPYSKVDKAIMLVKLIENISKDVNEFGIS